MALKLDYNVELQYELKTPTNSLVNVDKTKTEHTQVKDCYVRITDIVPAVTGGTPAYAMSVENGSLVRYENAQNTCNIINSASNDTQRILDKLCQMESNAKDQRISDLQLQLQSAQGQLSNLAQTASIVNQVRPTPIPAFMVGNPYYAGNCNSCNYGC